MRFDMNKFQQGCFEDHVVRQGKNYDYVWCISDVNVHRHVDFYEVLFLAGGPAYHYYQGQEQIKCMLKTKCVVKFQKYQNQVNLCKVI